MEDTTVCKVAYSERRIRAVNSGYRHGVGIRFIRAGRQYLAHTSDVTIDGMQRSVNELIPLLGATVDPVGRANGWVRIVAPGGAELLASGPEISVGGCTALVDAAADGANDAAKLDGCDIDLGATRRSIRIINTAGIDVSSTAARTELTVDCTIDQGTHLDNGRRNRGEIGAPHEVPPTIAHRVGRLAGEGVVSASQSPGPTMRGPSRAGCAR